MHVRVRHSSIAIQISIALLLAVVLMRAPTTGAMLVVPLTPAAAAMLPARLFAHGQARLIGAGPLPRSLIVEGDRAGIRAAAGRGALLVAAPSLLCGGRA